ncbi:MAG: hypothetical protein QXQ70_03930, partial [Candidatus Caldarchaeum sp.]
MPSLRQPSTSFWVALTQTRPTISSASKQARIPSTKITDVPAGAGDELFVDTIPVELTDGFIELLRRGVRVFYVRRLT